MGGLHLVAEEEFPAVVRIPRKVGFGDSILARRAELGYEMVRENDGCYCDRDTQSDER
jgi:hypothetical protein